MHEADSARHRWAPVVVPMWESVTPEEPANTTAGEVVRFTLASSVARLDAHEPDARLGEDPEDVHQARVATRRLRSDLRTFGDLVEPRWAASLRDELRWLGGEFGAVRDIDVLEEGLRERIQALPLTDGVAAQALLERLRESRERARRDLMTALDSRRYAELHHRLEDASRAPHLGAGALMPAAEALVPLVRQPWKKLKRAVHRVGNDPSDEALHEVRIRAKRCRYAADAAAPALGESYRRFARAVARLQDRLGEHQDAIVAEAWARGEAAGGPPDLAFVAGELAAAERAAAVRARREWPRAWRVLKRAQPEW